MDITSSDKQPDAGMMHTKRFHNIFDIQNCNEDIGDRVKLRSFIEEIARAIDMTILEGPIMAQGVDVNPGLSGVAIVDFSHISIHTFTKYKEALIDVFSCKAYDKAKVQEVCKKYFMNPDSSMRQKEVWWG